MGYTRVIYTDSTTAECGTILKTLNFEEDPKAGCYLLTDDLSVKVYIVWGKADYYPEIQKRLRFGPRVQVHLKTKAEVDKLDSFTREAVVALRNLDPNTIIQVFNADTGDEVHE
jgi:hypothetical protein